MKGLGITGTWARAISKVEEPRGGSGCCMEELIQGGGAGKGGRGRLDFRSF